MNRSHVAPPDPPLRAVVFDLDGLMVNTEDIAPAVTARGTTLPGPSLSPTR